MSLKTRLTERYDLQTPIVQAGMAFAGMTPPLGIAVSQAGAMGSIAGVGILPPEVVRMLVAETQAGTAKAFHVNFITPFTSDELIELMCELRPPAVSFHWGHPSPTWIEKLHSAGVDVWEQVGTVDAARAAAGDGVDLVIAQGSEAGGHSLGSVGALALTPAVVDAIGDTTLVLAAGGVTDGRGLAAALMLGADGVSIGTRFVASREAAVADEYKDRLVASNGQDTALTHVFGREQPDFNPMRVLRTGLVEQWENKVDQIAAGDAHHPEIGRMALFGQPTPIHRFSSLVPMQGSSGDFDEMALPAGQGIDLIRDCPPAAELVGRMTAQARAALTSRGGLE